MHVTINQNNLHTALSFLQKAIPTKPQLPILSSIYMNTHEGGVDLCATDLYFGVKTTIPFVTLKQAGEIVIPGKLFKETIASLNQGEVAVSLDVSKVTIKAKNVKTSLQVPSSQDYPPFPVVEGVAFDLPYEHIVTIEKLLKFATSTDVARPVLTALFFKLGPTGLTVVATDGFRLGILTFTDITAETEQELLIPSTAFVEISRIMNVTNADKAQFTVSSELKQVLCQFKDVQVFIRLIEGNYPPYQRIIPEEFLTEVLFDVEELLEQTKRAMIFSRDTSNIISFQFNQEEAKITAQSPTFGSYEGQLESAKVTGEIATISFNAKYLLDVLQALKTGTVWFGMKESLKPALFKHMDIPEYQYVIMPFKVNS